jgi:cobalt transporter subunit CbtB
MEMQNDTTTAQLEIVAPKTANKAPAIIALAFGAFIISLAGFAGSNTLHNATHDARHAFAFPCH